MKWTTRNILFCGCAVALSGGHSTTALAAAPNAGATPSGQSTLEEVVVTAHKRSESLQKVAGSVAALTGQELVRRGITNIQGLAMQVPSLNFGEVDGATFINIRGVGANIDTGVVEPSVASYVDGVFLSRSTMGNLDQSDLQRVEVLRGPQGTLYGRNATGGAINFVSQKPTDDFEAGITGKVGNYDDRGVNAYISGSLANGLTGRFSGGFEDRDGYVKDIANGSSIDSLDLWHVRGALRFQPTSNFTADLSVQFQRDDSNSAYQQTLTPSTSPLVPAGTLQTNQPWQVASTSPGFQKKDTLIVAATEEWKISDQISLRSITGLVNHRDITTFDGDATSYALTNVSRFVRPTETVSQELNLYGDTGRLKWLVGAYYFHEHFYANLPAVLPNGVAGLAPAGTAIITTLDQKTDSYALFTDVTYSITDALKLNGGLRLNTERDNFTQAAQDNIPGLGLLGPSGIRSHLEETTLLPKIGAQYYFNTDINIYASYQIGQKSGGENLATPLSPYSSERLTAYEAGVKSRFLAGALTFNISGFHYDYNNLQIERVVGGTTTAVENGNASIDGAEADLNAKISRYFKINAGFTILDAKYTKFVSDDGFNPAAGPENLAGQPLDRAPKYSFNFGAQWTVPIDSYGLSDLAFRGDLFHSASYVLLPYPDPGQHLPDYTIVDLSAQLSSADGHYSIRAFANNVTQTKYLIGQLYVPVQGAYLGNYAPPRMFGLEVSAKF
jgi:iron complex outermembrane receptor protein